jgi:glyoxylase-like metal-dependent hydrolase (beta-lactamase superfamily II)
MKPEVTSFFDDATNTVSYVIADPQTHRCAIIDSVLDYDPNSGRTSLESAEAIGRFVRDKGYQVEWILETHAHADHLSAAQYLQATFDAPIGIGEHITDVQEIFGNVFNLESDFSTSGAQFDHLFKDGEVFSVGGLEIRALHTPGHTPACLSYLCDSICFVGDTLFMPDYGTARADFPGGDAATLFRSIRRLFELPDDTTLYMCHDYLPEGRKKYQWQTTVGAERAANIHVHDGISEADFVAMREARDKTLDMPKLILPSVQINIRAGKLPPPESNGTSYLKIPLDTL